MTTARIHAQSYRRQRGLGLIAASGSIAVMLLLLAISANTSHGAAAFLVCANLSLAFGMAYFVASVQLELLSKPFCFMLPGMREAMLKVQFYTGTGVAVVAFGTAFLLPELAGKGIGAWSLACLALTIYAVIVLLVFQLAKWSWLPFAAPWFFFPFATKVNALSTADISAFLHHPVLFTAAGGLVVFLVWQQMSGRGLHRSRVQEPFLSATDLANQERLAAYRTMQNQNKDKKQLQARPLAGLMRSLIDRAHADRQVGNISRALVRESFFLSAGKMIPETSRVLRLVVLGFLAALVLMSYVGSRSENGGWYEGLPFMIIVHLSILTAYLRISTSGRIISRTDRYRAGWQGVAFVLALSVGISLLCFGFIKFMALFMPSFTLKNLEWSMRIPGWHVVIASLTVMPLQLLVFVLWRCPRCHGVLVNSGSLLFMVYHGTFVMAPAQFGFKLVVGVTILSWILLAWAWRWRALRSDHI